MTNDYNSDNLPYGCRVVSSWLFAEFSHFVWINNLMALLHRLLPFYYHRSFWSLFLSFPRSQWHSSSSLLSVCHTSLLFLNSLGQQSQSIVIVDAAVVSPNISNGTCALMFYLNNFIANCDLDRAAFMYKISFNENLSICSAYQAAGLHMYVLSRRFQSCIKQIQCNLGSRPMQFSTKKMRFVRLVSRT